MNAGFLGGRRTINNGDPLPSFDERLALVAQGVGIELPILLRYPKPHIRHHGQFLSSWQEK